jgi:folate-binding protein YgfZ
MSTNGVDVLDQYRALRDGRGVVELVGWSSLTLTGADRQKFLNGFCTNDVKRLTAGANCEAFVTNVKGRILGHGLVDCRDDELVFITVPGQSPAIMAHLDRYIIREDVQLRDTTSERSYALVTGQRAVDRSITWKLLHTTICGLAENTAAASQRELQKLVESGAVLCGDAAFHVLRVEAGTPLFGVDFDESNLPQEVGRDDLAISFTKGCYLGQETVARIDALGHVNQQLAGVRFTGVRVPDIGTQLAQGTSTAGRVTSATYSPQLDAPLALAMVRREWLAPGTRMESPYGECEIVSLPLDG